MIFIKILRSRYFWFLIAGLTVLLLFTKDGFSKLIKVIKLLGTLFQKTLDLTFGLFNLKFNRITNFQETTEI